MLKIVNGQQVSDGAGVRLNRVIGTNSLDNANPFYLLDEFRSDKKEDYIAGFPMHPHRGIETITYMIEGNFIHRDSQGNEGSLKAGEVQWMTAGKGILHEEMPQMENGHLWGYQLWINLPSKLKMIEPKYRHIKKSEIPIVEKDGIQVKIIAGSFEEVQGAVVSSYPVDYLDVRLDKGSFDREAKETNIIYVHSGKVTVAAGDEQIEIEAGNLIVVEEASSFKVTGEKSGILYLGGTPIKEPVYRYGPFIMNTVDEIIQAVDDYNSSALDK
ncbi:MAG: pirin family protein [Bacillota bacterium]|nr:pirin family protein [Bacillota bacterium]